MRTSGVGVALLATAVVATTLGACAVLEPRPPIKEGAEVQVASGKAGGRSWTATAFASTNGELCVLINLPGTDAKATCRPSDTGSSGWVDAKGFLVLVTGPGARTARITLPGGEHLELQAVSASPASRQTVAVAPLGTVGLTASGQSTRIEVLGRDSETIEIIAVMLDDR